MLIIKSIVHKSRAKNVTLSNLIDKIFFVMENLHQIEVFHVLRNLNAAAYSEAKKERDIPRENSF